MKRITDARQLAASAAGKVREEIFRALTARKRARRSTGFTNRQLDANRLFFWLVRFGHLVLEKLIRKSPTCHYPILLLRKM